MYKDVKKLFLRNKNKLLFNKVVIKLTFDRIIYTDLNILKI